MIARVEGIALEQNEHSIVVGVSGIGLLVFVTKETAEFSKIGSKLLLYTYTAVRENSLDLFGFRTKEELSMFHLLLTISGIGPKKALGILDVASPSVLAKAVRSEDPGHLSKISGIGTKNAEKIVIELKDKIGSITSIHELEENPRDDALLAIVALGYSEKEARDAIRKIDTTLDTQSRIKLAIKYLAGK
ncbi:MAG: Holliday junction branch migration protein RuvA [Patescibacteria group bacterium]